LVQAFAQRRLSHVAFETDNIQQLRDYLAGKGVKVPATLKTGGDGNISFMIDEPGGHKVEFVEYKPGSLHSSRFGKMMPETRASKRNPTPKTLGVINHMALGVESIQEPYKQVMDRGMKPQAPPKVGRDGK
jgi:hypothetical protein